MYQDQGQTSKDQDLQNMALRPRPGGLEDNVSDMLLFVYKLSAKTIR